MKRPILDIHCDLLSYLTYPESDINNTQDVGCALPHLQNGNVKLQVTAIFAPTQLNLPVEPFILAVLFGANLSYATPMAYKTNILVMNAGGYQFSDFIRVGVPLIILMWVTLSFLLSWIYL